MALDVGTLVAYLTVDPRSMDKGLREGESRFKKFGRGLNQAANVIGAGIASVLVTQIPGMISAASDLAETQSKVSVIFGDAADAIFDYAETASTSIGQSKQSALDAATTFATFGKGAGLAGDELSKFSLDLLGLSSDLSSFYNADPSQTIEALGAALRGEAEPIRQFGVLLDEATIKAKAIEMGLLKSTVSVDEVRKANLNARIAQQAYNDEVKKSGPNSLAAEKKAMALKDAQAKLREATSGTVGELSKQNKVIATAGAIFDQTKDAQGDFDRTSDGLANQQRILTAEFENAKAELGQGLLPVALDFVNVLRDLLDFGLRNKDWLIPFIGILGTLAAIIKVATVLQWAWNAAMAANPIGLIILAIVALVAIILWLWNNSAGFRDFFIGMWDGIKAAALAVGRWFAGPFADFFKRWYAEARAIFLAIVKFAVDKFNWWVGFLKSLPGKVRDIFRSVGEAIYGAIRAAINMIIDAWNALDFSVNIRVPEWVPGFGGSGFSIADVIPDIPRLFRGGLVEGSHRGTPVIMGDGNRPEIASPEPLMRKVVREESGRGDGRDGTLTVVFEGRGIMRGIRKKVRVGGGNPDVVLVGG